MAVVPPPSNSPDTRFQFRNASGLETFPVLFLRPGDCQQAQDIIVFKFEELELPVERVRELGRELRSQLS